MNIKSKLINVKKIFFLVLYYGFAQYLPDSYCSIKLIGKTSNWLRVTCVKHIFKRCGHIRTINRRVSFDSGRNVEIGNESGIGARTHIPSNTIIGNHVIISRDCYLWHANHIFERTDIPLNDQGIGPALVTKIEDDCWIGMRSLLTPGRHIHRGTIVGMGSVVTKDFPSYSIIGGAPAKLIRNRLDKKSVDNNLKVGSLTDEKNSNINS